MTISPNLQRNGPIIISKGATLHTSRASNLLAEKHQPKKQLNRSFKFWMFDSWRPPPGKNVWACRVSLMPALTHAWAINIWYRSHAQKYWYFWQTSTLREHWQSLNSPFQFHVQPPNFLQPFVPATRRSMERDSEERKKKGCTAWYPLSSAFYCGEKSGRITQATLWRTPSGRSDVTGSGGPQRNPLGH